MDLSNVTPAVLRYSPNDFEMVEQGDYVLCGVTGDPIALDSLRYWCVARQIAFRDVAVANKALSPATAPSAEAF